MNSRYRKYLVISLTALALYGCSSTCKDRGECECATRFDCPEGQFCRDGACVVDDQEPWIVPERKFGETCIGHRECIDGVCLPIGPDNGGVCSTFCKATEDCEEGWSCKAWTSSDYFSGGEHVCVQDIAPKLCLPCAVDGHCNATGDLCVALPEGRVCARDCSKDACPEGYTCETVEHDGASYAQCLPLDNSCECGPGKEGMGRACTNSNEFGICAGWSFCRVKDGEYVWSDCDAAMPAEEVCNGIDDDCDGLVDGFDPGLTHDELGEDGALYPICYLGGCVGRWQCKLQENGFGWSCDAGDPEREICNGADDNCNGEIDEAFMQGELYVDLNNCGACGASCLAVLSHLKHGSDGKVSEDAAACEVHDGAAVCVPLECEPGYYPYPHENPVSCLKLESPACQVCGADEDCHVYSDRCLDLDGDFGKHCLQSCDVDSPYPGCTGNVGEQSCCPDGYTCRDKDGGKFCVPKGESCSCDASKLNMVRNCAVSAGTDVCQGRQTCEKIEGDTFAWSVCSAETLTLEVCDGQDNNCNGEIDEDFKDDKGRYNAEEHCGACNEDCPSRWKAPELHATGACLLDGEDYACKFTGCKLEKEIYGKQCREDRDCGAGMRCDRQIFYCVAETGETTSASCTADSDCKKLSSAHTCVDNVCRVEIQYYDVNGIAADGCECGVAVNGSADEPDVFNEWPTANSLYIDRNCDGVDGTISTSLFVSAQSTSSKGTIDAPYRTISEAVAAFDVSKHTAILVAAGTYLEHVELKSGVQIFGGYSADFRSRNVVLNPTQIMGQPPAESGHPGSVYIPSVKRKTVMSGFTIHGYDVSESQAADGSNGRNSYAIFMAEASKYIYLSSNMIIAGRAEDGGRGASGDSGYAGGDGVDGKDSRECSDHYCDGQSTPGGKGGANSHCSSANGRVGATSRGGGVEQDFYYGNERDGAGGANNSYNHSYEGQEPYCKYDCTSGGYANGSNGLNGENGGSGLGGNGCFDALGSVVNNEWVGSRGSDGERGHAATGGGGGGAGGSAVNNNDNSCIYGNPVGDIGGSGGGGGAGGCGGEGGQGGGAGGGSFGIWIAAISSEPMIYANQIRLGVPGKGGDGGGGGAGGKGGKGGVGGRSVAPAWCAGAGGSGGGGGDGGSGGGGGGGCGGISAGIAGLGIAQSIEDKNTFIYPEDDESKAYGVPGNGGDSPAGEHSVGAVGGIGKSYFILSF